MPEPVSVPAQSTVKLGEGCVAAKAETWLQGEGCKFNKGWEVRNMRPWRKA